MPGEPAKQQLALDEFKAENGVSYTVQVRPAGDALWQTVAVGRPDSRRRDRCQSVPRRRERNGACPAVDRF